MRCSYIYELSTGRILQLTAPAVLNYSGDTTGVVHAESIEIDGPLKYYVSDNQLVLRPSMSLVASTDVNVNEIWRLSGIPYGTKVKYLHNTVVVDDGYIEWSSAVPGTFKFELSCFPYLDTEVYATVTDI